MSCLIRSGANIGSGGHRSPPLSIIRHRSTPQPAGAAIDRIQEPAQRRIVSGAAAVCGWAGAACGMAGANIAGFIKVADAMLDQGTI